MRQIFSARWCYLDRNLPGNEVFFRGLKRRGRFSPGLVFRSVGGSGSRKMSFRDLKDLVYESRYFARTSSHTLYTGARKRSNLGRKPSSQEQYQRPEQ